MFVEVVVVTVIAVTPPVGFDSRNQPVAAAEPEIGIAVADPLILIVISLVGRSITNFAEVTVPKLTALSVTVPRDRVNLVSSVYAMAEFRANVVVFWSVDRTVTGLTMDA